MTTKNNLQNPAERPFVFSRTFDAPRDRVWQAWTQRDRLTQWFTPKGFKMTTAKLDLRPGGMFHYRLRSPEGTEMWGKFVYRQIVAPQTIVLVNSFSDEEGGMTRHPMSPTWPLEMLSTFSLAEQDGKTTVTVQWIPLNATDEERKTFDAAREGMKQGWTGTFDQLATYLAKQRPFAKAEMLIRKPVAEVFEAFVNPDITSQFWFTKGSGRLEAGKEVKWDWEMYDFSVQVKVRAVEKNARILIEWPGEGAPTTVEWIFTPRPDGTTFVSITNTGFSGDQDQMVQQAIDSTEGFTLVLAGLKALLEHNIRLNLVSDRFPDALGKRGKEGKP